jgi:hypothetical protein
MIQVLAWNLAMAEFQEAVFLGMCDPSMNELLVT